MTEIREQLISAFAQLGQDIVNWTPRVILGLVLVVAAVLVAKIIERLLRALFTRLGVDGLVGKLGIDQMFESLGITNTLNHLIPRFVYYLLLFLFARTAADALGLAPISSAIGSFMAYLPNVLAAVLVVVLGTAAAQFAGRAVSHAAGNTGIEFAGSLGTMVSGILLFVVMVTAISQLRIDTEIVRILTWSTLGGMVLALGLSFGLGTRDITRNIIAGFYARKTLHIGDRVEVSGEHGTLSAITPTQTLLEQDGTTIAVANSVFLEEIVKRTPAK